MTSRIQVVMLMGALMVGIPPSAVASSDDTVASAEETNVAQAVLVRLRESVMDNWGKLSKWCKKTIALHAEMADLPDSAWIFADKNSQREKIREKLMDIRELLLSTNAQKIMGRIDDIDERIAEQLAVDAHLLE